MSQTIQLQIPNNYSPQIGTYSGNVMDSIPKARMQPAAADLSAAPGLLATAWQWFIADFFHVALVAFFGIIIFQLINNKRHKRARIGTPLAIGFVVMSIWGVILNFNGYIGGILAGLSVLLLYQASNYTEDSEEVEEEPEPIKQQRQIPIQQPLRPIPQPHVGMFEGYQFPRIGINLGNL